MIKLSENFQLQISILGSGLNHKIRISDPFLAEGQFLWIFRAVLLVAIGLHVWAAITLKLLSNAARPVGYKKVTHQESTAASRTMIWGGILLLIFIVFHILHFTTGDVAPGFTFEHGKVFNNVTGGLSVPAVAGFYLLAMIFLGLHLYHGVWSMLQTLGANHPRYNTLFHRIALLVALIVTLGNISMKNRLAMAPMTRARSPERVPTESVATYYAQRAGAGSDRLKRRGPKLRISPVQEKGEE